uniref:Ethylene-responsive transcription factor 1B n=2 Tax=Cajanus cajan TaxID=3821 RepID=A0A151TXN9_CAJCA|nr:Ethylene-responsive transcription factor 1B [Cajanus cajan]
MRGSMAVLNFSAETVRQSLRNIDCASFQQGSSPVLELKKRHAINRKTLKNKNLKHLNNLIVLEDLGTDYLEQLLTLSSQDMDMDMNAS